jgi:hypothetical protein
MKITIKIYLLLISLLWIETEDPQDTSHLSAEDEAKRVKLMACVNLSKSRLLKDDVKNNFINIIRSQLMLQLTGWLSTQEEKKRKKQIDLFQ